MRSASITLRLDDSAALDSLIEAFGEGGAVAMVEEARKLPSVTVVDTVRPSEPEEPADVG
jgi:hypothetical protein